MDLMSKEKSDVLFIQETMLSKQTNFIWKNYNGLFKEGHTNYGAHGGVAISMHKTIPPQKLVLNTPLLAIAARINRGRDVTIVSISNQGWHNKPNPTNPNQKKPTKKNHCKQPSLKLVFWIFRFFFNKNMFLSTKRFRMVLDYIHEF